MLRLVDFRSDYKRALAILKVRDNPFDGAPREVLIDGRGMAIKQPFQSASVSAAAFARPVGD